MTVAIQDVTCTIEGEIVVHGLSPKVHEHCVQKFVVTNPKYLKNKQFLGVSAGEPQYLYAAISMPNGDLHVPRGMWQELRVELAKYDLRPVRTHDRRSIGHRILRDGLKPIPFELRDYQRIGIDASIQKQQGLIVLPPGVGKSKLGLGCILIDPRTTLILVPTIDIGDQWEADALEVGFNVGRIGDGRKEFDKDVIVSTFDSTIEKLEKDPSWGFRFGRVIVDEVHHAAGAGLQRALRSLPAKYRLGLTATIEREDRLTDLIYWSFGEILLERTTKEMIAAGYLMPADIEIVSTGFKWSYEGPEKKRLATLEKDVASDLARNALIAQRVAQMAMLGETCLVLAREREHVKELAKLIEKFGNIECRPLTGKTAKKQRKKTVDDLRSGKLQVATATSLADEGLDLQRLSVIALAAPQRAQGRTWQKLGRLLRFWKGKKPRLIDFVDDDVDTLASRATARRKVYREAGLIP